MLGIITLQQICNSGFWWQPSTPIIAQFYLTLLLCLSLKRCYYCCSQDSLPAFSGLKQEIVSKPVGVKIGSVEVRMTFLLK